MPLKDEDCEVESEGMVRMNKRISDTARRLLCHGVGPDTNTVR